MASPGALEPIFVVLVTYTLGGVFLAQTMDNKQYIALLVLPFSSLLGAELLGFFDDDMDSL